jgi:putative SOS response-associated peptidase YedK
MCGRYVSLRPAEGIVRLIHVVNPIPNLPPTWNVAPTQDAMVVRHHPQWQS